MTLEEKIAKSKDCAAEHDGRCARNGYPPFDCGTCRSFETKSTEKKGGKS